MRRTPFFLEHEQGWRRMVLDADDGSMGHEDDEDEKEKRRNKELCWSLARPRDPTLVHRTASPLHPLPLKQSLARKHSTQRRARLFDSHLRNAPHAQSLVVSDSGEDGHGRVHGEPQAPPTEVRLQQSAALVQRLAVDHVELKDFGALRADQNLEGKGRVGRETAWVVVMSDDDAR